MEKYLEAIAKCTLKKKCFKIGGCKIFSQTLAKDRLLFPEDDLPEDRQGRKTISHAHHVLYVIMNFENERSTGRAPAIASKL